ncbi:MAG: hypothetical protein E3J93_00370, partial [Dehalococcoidia bacterium]
MGRKSKIRCGGLIFRGLAGFMFIALAIALPSMSMDFTQEPSRLGSGQVYSIAFSPDGTILAAWHEARGAVLLWDVEAQKQVGSLIGHLDITDALAFSPDRTILASAGGWYDKAVYLWDFRAQKQVGVLGGHSAHIGSVAFSPNGKLLVSTVFWDDTVHFWDVKGQKQVGVLTGHDASDMGWFDQVAFSPDGKWLACGSQNGVELWELNLPGPISRAYAYGPQPFDGTLHADTWINLAWMPGDIAVSHDVYLGESFDDVNSGAEGTFVGNQAVTSLIVGLPGFAIPDGLVPGKTYYWRIDEVNETEPNSPWKGNVWSFSIPPKTAYFPNPADGAESVNPNVELNWTAGFGSRRHTVYFGENFDDVKNATGGLNQVATTYTPGPLKLAKTYYWRVDELTGGRDSSETLKGDVWSFTTEGAVGSPNPSNGAVDVKQTQIITWSPGIYAASHQVYFGNDQEAVRN